MAFPGPQIRPIDPNFPVAVVAVLPVAPAAVGAGGPVVSWEKPDLVQAPNSPTKADNRTAVHFGRRFTARFPTASSRSARGAKDRAQS